jgi:hypothetical protein
MNVLPPRLSLQSIAAKCTKVGNEQPSKQPLGRPADFSIAAFGSLSSVRSCSVISDRFFATKLLSFCELRIARLTMHEG